MPLCRSRAALRPGGYVLSHYGHQRYFDVHFRLPATPFPELSPVYTSKHQHLYINNACGNSHNSVIFSKYTVPWMSRWCKWNECTAGMHLNTCLALKYIYCRYTFFIHHLSGGLNCISLKSNRYYFLSKRIPKVGASSNFLFPCTIEPNVYPSDDPQRYNFCKLPPRCYVIEPELRWGDT